MFKKIIKNIKSWNKKRVAYIQLTQMSDKTLKDIGLTRNDLYNKIYRE